MNLRVPSHTHVVLTVTQPLGLWHTLDQSEGTWTWLNTNWGMLLGYTQCTPDRNQLLAHGMRSARPKQNPTRSTQCRECLVLSTRWSSLIRMFAQHYLLTQNLEGWLFWLKMPRLVSRPLLRFKFNQKYFKGKFLKGHFSYRRPGVWEGGCIFSTTACGKHFFLTQIHAINTWATSYPVFWREKFHTQTFVIIDRNSNLSITTHEIYLFPEKQ